MDLLLELPDGYVAIEVKQARRAAHVDGRHLRGLNTILDKPILGGLILSQDPAVKTFDDKITGLPAAWALS